MASRKRSLSDMQYSKPPSKAFDEEAYRATVLQLPADVSEDDLDQNLNTEAEDLGIVLPLPSAAIDCLASSLSAITISSDLNNRSSGLSQSTGPTSCASSYHRPATQSSVTYKSRLSSSQSITPSMISENEKRKGLGFRDGIRRMTGFKRRRSIASTPSAIGSINSNTLVLYNGDRISIQSGLKSPASIESSKSSWSNSPSAPRAHYEDPPPPPPEDKDAIKRTRECKELASLRNRQLEERSRFAEFHKRAIAHLRLQHQAEKLQLIDLQRQLVVEALDKNEKAIEDLESRHLEAEMKLVDEFELAKRAILVRLRHMEAYVQNPSPPPTPQTSTPARHSDELNLPERKVTDRDYHYLAQQYRERDSMETLHRSKIEVLRGKQNKALETFAAKKDREMLVLKSDHAKAIKATEEAQAQEEEGMNDEFNEKRKRLEARWRLQSGVERTKIERITGLRYADLPDVLVGSGNANGHSTLKEGRSWSVSS